MRAVIDSGIVPTAAHGRIRCQMASRKISKCPVINELNVTELEASVTKAYAGPVRLVR